MAEKFEGRVNPGHLCAANPQNESDAGEFEQWTEWLPGQDSNLQPCG